jgi:hypothetical protein
MVPMSAPWATPSARGPCLTEGNVDPSVALVDVISNSFTAAGGEGYDAFGAADEVKLMADDGSQVYYEGALREYLEVLPAGADGIPLVRADDQRYAMS